MNRAVAILVALFLAVHVSVPGIPAPVPVFLAASLVIGALLWLILETAFVPVPYRRTTWARN